MEPNKRGNSKKHFGTAAISQEQCPFKKLEHAQAILSQAQHEFDECKKLCAIAIINSDPYFVTYPDSS